MLEPADFLVAYVMLAVLAFVLAIKSSLLHRSLLIEVVCLYVLLALVIGLRTLNVGVDTATFFSWVPDTLTLYQKEPLYWNLATFGKMMMGPTGSLLAISVPTIYFTYKYYAHTFGVAASDFRDEVSARRFNVGLLAIISFCLLIASSDFLLLVMNQVRQGLAGALLGTVAIFYYKKRKVWIVFAVLAPLAHISAVFILPLIFLAKIIKRPGIIFIFLALSIAIWRGHLVNSLIQLVPSSYIEDKASVDIYQSALVSEQSLLLKTFLSASFILFLPLFLPKEDGRGRQLYMYIYSIFSLIMIASIAFLDFGEGANRIQRYACFFLPSAIVLALNKFKQSTAIYLITIVASAMYFVFMINYPSITYTIGFR